MTRPIAQSAPNAERSTQLRLGLQFVSHLNSLLKVTQLYPIGHSMLDQIINQSFVEVTKLIAQEGQIVLRIYENSLYVSEQSLTGSQAESLLREMQKHSIRQLTFETAVTLNDLKVLIEMFNTAEEAIEAAGGPLQFMRQNGVEHLRVAEYYRPRYFTFDPAQLAELCNSELFRFLVADDQPPPSQQELSHFYAVTQNPILGAAFFNEATRVVSLKGQPPLAQEKIFIKLLCKLKQALGERQFLEDDELGARLSDIILALDPESLFDLLVTNVDHKLLSDCGLWEQVVRRFGLEKIAALISPRIAGNNTATTIANLRSVMANLLSNQNAVLAFQPMLKEKLQQLGLSNIDDILNQILAPSFEAPSPAGSIESCLGMVATSEQKEITSGLEVLKDIAVDRLTLQEWIKNFDVEINYSWLVRDLLNNKKNMKFDIFQHLLNQLVNYLKQTSEKEDFSEARRVVNFIIQLVTAEPPLTAEKKSLVIDTVQQVDPKFWGKLINNQLNLLDPSKANQFLIELQQLFTNKSARMLLDLYLYQKMNAPNEALQKLLRQETVLKDALQNYDGNLDLNSAPAAGRFLDLCEHCLDPIVMVHLWKLTFHEDRQLAQRSLRLIARNHAPERLTYLLKALEHQTLILRLLSIELLGGFNSPEVTARLLLIARGKDPCLTKDIAPQLRLAALESLKQINLEVFQRVLVELKKRRKRLFFNTEPKIILAYVRKELL